MISGISELLKNISLGFDVEFMSWLICSQMALRFIGVLLKLSITMNVPKEDPCANAEEQKKEELMNETFESISSIDEASTTMEDLNKSYVNFYSYDIDLPNDDMFAKSSTPKRGHYLPLSIQNQLYNTSMDQSSFNSRDSFLNKLHGYRGTVDYKEMRLWPKGSKLCVSLASDVSDTDSIDGTFDDVELTHEERLKQRRSLDNNVMKLEEKCELLEDKNSKLMRTLNVIMKENKDTNEKLRITQVEKSKMTRELQEMDHKLQKIFTDKKAFEGIMDELKDERATAEKEVRKCYSELKQLEIKNHGLQRQISMKDGENESLRQQIVEMRTEISASKVDREMLNKQVEEQEEKCKTNEKDIEELSKGRDAMLGKLQELCLILGKASADGEEAEDNGEVRRRTKSCNAGDSEGTFETELFVAIENNIKIESIINDVRGKLEKMVGAKDGDESARKEKRQLTIVEPRNCAKTMKRNGGRLSRSSETKTSTLRRAKSLRTERKPVASNSEAEGVVPRGSKIKELMNEKIKIEKNFKELVLKNEKVEEELKTAKTQIEMLVKECGILDHQLANMKKQSPHREDLKFPLETVKDSARNSDESLFLRTTDINRLGETQEEMKKEMQESQKRIEELESELAINKDENTTTKRQMREIERKYEAAKNELHHYENQNYSQKIENTRLRDHVIQLSQELNREQQRVEQLSSKLSSVKERNVSHIRKLENEMMKCVKKLDRYKEKERDRRQHTKQMGTNGKDSSEADSGLVPDHSDENIDLT